MKLFMASILACAVTSGVTAQQINTPLQDERLNPVDCLMAAETLVPTYRTHLSKSCIEIPKKVCQVRGTALPCLADTIDTLQRFLRKNRVALPDTIDAAGLAANNYRRALGRLDAMLAGTDTCNDGSDLEKLECQYDQTAFHLVDMFYRARQAQVDLSK